MIRGLRGSSSGYEWELFLAKEVENKALSVDRNRYEGDWTNNRFVHIHFSKPYKKYVRVWIKGKTFEPVLAENLELVKQVLEATPDLIFSNGILNGDHRDVAHQDSEGPGWCITITKPTQEG